MTTQANAKRIVNSFETLGLTPEQISENEQVALAIVKSVLFQGSTEYRKSVKKNAALDFTDDEAEEMRQLILRLARTSEDEHMVFKAARYVRDDKKGRLDIGKNLQQFGSFNVVNFNIQHANAQKAIERTKAVEINSSVKSNGELIEVE